MAGCVLNLDVVVLRPGQSGSAGAVVKDGGTVQVAGNLTEPMVSMRLNLDDVHFDEHADVVAHRSA